MENHQTGSLRATGYGRQSARLLRWAHDPSDPRPARVLAPGPPRLRTHRRHRRDRDPQGRRQGQGAQGRGTPGHRLRRRRARLPDPGLRRRGRGRGLPRPEEPSLHPGRRPSRAEEGDRGEDPARQRVRRRAGAGAGHQRRQAGDLRGVRHHARPRRRGDRAGAVLDDVPRGHPAGRRRPGRGARRRDPGLQGHGRAARGRAHRADQGAAVRLAVEPHRRRLHRRRDPGDRPVGRGPPAVGAHRRDLRAPGLRRRRDRLDARSCAPSSPTTASSSTGSPRPTR